MTLPAQKFANTFRTINGLINIVYDSDVILLCDTSLGAVSVDLAEIPADLWNTVYKLYVIDKSNNASVNNITIKAPLGYTVNNASTFVVNVNGGSAIVRIVSNTAYVAETNYVIASSSLAVQNEGLPITASATTMNFVGAGVNATAVGGFVTIDIAGTAVVPLTSAQLLTLIATNAIVPNTCYLVSNAIFTQEVPENVPILVQGVTTNSVSLSGSGIFLNADYQQIGNYSGVSGFVSNLGVWQSTVIPVIGSVVMWDNLQYVNITGSNGILSPSVDAVNWSVLSKSTTNGYIQEIDDITYQPSTNYILTRTDVRNNRVENNPISFIFTVEAFYRFQWGNNQVQSNIVDNDSAFWIQNNLVIGTPLGIGAIYGNTISGVSGVVLFVNGVENSGTFRYNEVTNNCSVEVGNRGFFESNNFKYANVIIQLNDSSIGGNIISGDFQSGLFRVNVANYSQITNNVISDGSALTINTNNGIIADNVFTQFTIATIGSNQGVIRYNTASNKSIFTIESNTIGGVPSGQIEQNIINSSSLLVTVVNTGLINQNSISESSTLRVETNTIFGTILQNIITQESSLVVTSNNGRIGQSGRYDGNSLTQQSVLTLGTVGNLRNVGSITSGQGSLLTLTTVNNDFGRLIINDTIITIGALNFSFINLNITKGFYVIATHNQNFEYGTFDYGVSTIKCQVDMSDPTVYDPATFTLTLSPPVVGLCGEITLINGGGSTINKILPILNSFAPTTFFSGNGIITFDSVAVGAALANELVSTLGATSFPIAFNAEAPDFIVFRPRPITLFSIKSIDQVNIYL